mgnify:CR=1 FL=1
MFDWLWKGRAVLKLKISIAGQMFEFDGEAPFADVFKLAGEFLHAVLADMDAVHSAVQQLEQQRATLKAAVDANP